MVPTKIKAPLSRECAERVAKALAEAAVACNGDERALAADLTEASGDLNWANEDKNRDDGYITLPYKSFALAMAELDWAYCNTDGGNV